MSVFDSWYEPTGTGSGVGSGLAYTSGYRTFLEHFMHEHAIHSVLDVGCGDWQFSKYVNWGDRIYVGQDEVAPLVARLEKEWGGYRGRYFVTEIPDQTFDLVICKDVMIHLPNAEVKALLKKLQCQATHLLLVNDFSPGPAVDCVRGSYRALDLNAEPFNLNAEILYTFPQLNNETKVVHHVCTT